MGPHLYTAQGPHWPTSLARVAPGGPSSAWQGAPDTTYRARVWGPGQAGVWWAPGGERLAYSTFLCQGGCGDIVKVAN